MLHKPGLQKPRRLLLGIHPMPTMVTLGNLLCGFGAVIMAIRAGHPPVNASANDCLLWAGRLIFVAMIFDLMDGKVARWTKSTSKFGLEMDSLADVISFGLAPAVLLKQMVDLQPSFPIPQNYVTACLAAYVCCAALRLARYNVEAQTGHRDFFFGMPTPGAAGCLASLAILIILVPGSGPRLPIQSLEEPFTWLENFRSDLHTPVLLALPFSALLLGVLMVSRVHFPHVGDRLLRGRKSFMHVIVLGLGLVLIGLHHEIMLAIAFNGYALFGLGNELRCQIFRAQRPPSWDVQAPEVLSAASPAKDPAAQ